MALFNRSGSCTVNMLSWAAVSTVLLLSNGEQTLPLCNISLVQEQLPFARISGCSVKDLLEGGAEGASVLKGLLLRHGFVVFADQQLTPAEEVAINKNLGWHLESEDEALRSSGWSPGKKDPYPILPSHPEVLCQGNVALDNHFGLTTHLKMMLTYSNEGFHSDGMHIWQKDLPVVTSMYNIHAPESGGQTLFACGRLAFQRAAPELQRKARRLLVHYIYDESLGRPIMQNGIKRIGFATPRNASSATPRKVVRTVHPLVRLHPETGEESVYVSCGNIDFMEAKATDTEPALHLDTEASYELLEDLLSPVTDAPLVYAHEWSVGDFVMWDNRLLLHSPGEPAEMTGQRLHHRVRLPGSAEANRDLSSECLSHEVPL
eukprot:gnl/TRDRNA2_/TRDRNA2_80507_c0_seq1.p1 gnl/TRDRNA2_/TRDRNA2_80507_c0~~gnl/TRDRNA2_/TRDRNA2_80507_c0_seq1.p1  ORF type:complete len:376 (+),score=45.04 gnl/TRDRNA2_/TRDRNA2_80507_c0_seq1:69-1196(+)